MKKSKSPRAGSGRAFFDPARARPGPVSGRAGLGPRVRGPGRPGPKEPGLARGGPARGPTLILKKIMKFFDEIVTMVKKKIF